MRRALALVLVLAGCASHNATSSKPDDVYDNAMDTGKSVFDLGHADQAEGQYRDALKRAYLRDDAADIHDAGFNLATSLLARNKPSEALSSVNTTINALTMRGSSHTVDLALIQAAAFYRLGDDAAALKAEHTALSDSDASVRNRAAYLTGLSAARMGDGALLSEMVAELTAPKAQAPSADAQELQANLALIRHDPAQALNLARQVIQKRRDTLDYDGMRRALHLASSAVEASGDHEAALAYQAQAAESEAAVSKEK